jgi:hypothetical protein
MNNPVCPMAKQILFLTNITTCITVRRQLGRRFGVGSGPTETAAASGSRNHQLLCNPKVWTVTEPCGTVTDTWQLAVGPPATDTANLCPQLGLASVLTAGRVGGIGNNNKPMAQQALTGRGPPHGEVCRSCTSNPWGSERLAASHRPYANF